MLHLSLFLICTIAALCYPVCDLQVFDGERPLMAAFDANGVQCFMLRKLASEWVQLGLLGMHLLGKAASD